MSKLIVIPISVSWLEKKVTRLDGGSIEFPDKCIYCCGPSEKIYKGMTAYYTQKAAGRVINRVNYKVKVPYCKKHLRESNWNSLIYVLLYTLFTFGALIPAYYVFRRDSPQEVFHITFGVIAWFLGAVVIGLIGTWIVKTAFSTIRPSFIDQSISAFPEGGSLGFSAKNVLPDKPDETPDRFLFNFKFANELYAVEFEKLNTPKLEISST
jgi:ABC-type sugar transport system permease subunit